MARFCSIASGSSGNCIYIEMGGEAILVDAGLSGSRIESGLLCAGADIHRLTALFVTHEHSDHSAGAGVLARRLGIPVYATNGTWAAMEKSIGRVKPAQKRHIVAGMGFHIGGIQNGVYVEPFEIPHDAAEPCGYSFTSGEERFADACSRDIKITVATDIGLITPQIRAAISGSDVLLIESNHDIDMLTYGRYPAHLKKRILGEQGHLSNVDCGVVLAEVFLLEKWTGLRHIYLGHLSEENNRPALAYETVRDILLSNGINVGETVKLYIARRDMAGNMLKI